MDLLSLIIHKKPATFFCLKRSHLTNKHSVLIYCLRQVKMAIKTTIIPTQLEFQLTCFERSCIIHSSLFNVKKCLYFSSSFFFLKNSHNRMSREKLSESYPRIKPGPLILILFEAPLLRTII